MHASLQCWPLTVLICDFNNFRCSSLGFQCGLAVFGFHFFPSFLWPLISDAWPLLSEAESRYKCLLQTAFVLYTQIRASCALCLVSVQVHVEPDRIGGRHGRVGLRQPLPQAGPGAAPVAAGHAQRVLPARQARGAHHLRLQPRPRAQTEASQAKCEKMSPSCFCFNRWLSPLFQLMKRRRQPFPGLYV